MEHKENDGVKNFCHYACSNINYTNIILIIIIFLLIYHFLISNFYKY